MESEGRIVVAMDKMDKKRVLDLTQALATVPGVWGFKFNDALDDKDMGPEFLGQLREKLPSATGIWADAKFKDIPNTMGNRVLKLCKACIPDLITIHASNTVAAMTAADKAAESYKTEILAVTVLTSMTEEDCQLIYGCSVKAAVLKFARNAVLSDLHGIVCSAKELEFLKAYPEVFEALKKVTPGIRPKWWLDKNQGTGDQKRVMTAGDAVKMGADLLVMGRPIYGEDDPTKAVADTMAEINAALANELAGDSEADG